LSLKNQPRELTLTALWASRRLWYAHDRRGTLPVALRQLRQRSHREGWRVVFSWPGLFTSRPVERSVRSVRRRRRWW